MTRQTNEYQEEFRLTSISTDNSSSSTVHHWQHRDDRLRTSSRGMMRGSVSS